jgi:hypothetical protein
MYVPMEKAAAEFWGSVREIADALLSVTSFPASERIGV